MKASAPKEADTVAEWVALNLAITQGEGVGDPFRYLPWEREFSEGLLAHSRSALSMARGGGKTSYIATLACAGLRGPLSAPRGDVVAVAAAKKQAKLIWDHCQAMMPDGWIAKARRSPDLEIDIVDGPTLRCMASNAGSLQGLAPILAIADEPASWLPSAADAVHQALRYSLGKLSGSRFVALGVRPLDRSHWFSKMLADETGKVFRRIYSMADGDDPFAEATWHKANPSLAHFPTLLSQTMEDAQDAMDDPAALSGFLNFRCNAGIAAEGINPLVHVHQWREVETEALPAKRGRSLFGVDLGSGAAMSALAAHWPDCGRTEAVAAFPDDPGLAERGKADKVGDLYVRLAAMGELVTHAGPITDVAQLLREGLRRFGQPSAVLCDDWRYKELLSACNKVGLRCPVLKRGQGWRDGAEDVRDFRKAVLTKSLRAPPSPLIRASLRESVTISDPAGNAKLAKNTEGGRRAKARDDVTAALLMAVAHGWRLRQRKDSRRKPRMAVVQGGAV